MELNLQNRMRKIRSSKEYQVWRKKVLIRDRFKCALCGIPQDKSKGIILEIDHIEPFLLNPDKIIDVKNGRALCQKCHRHTETYGNTTKYRIARQLDIHPFLVGDFLYKLEKLPSSIQFGDG